MHPLLILLLVLLGLPVVAAILTILVGLAFLTTADWGPSDKRDPPPTRWRDNIIWAMLAILGLTANSVAINYLGRAGCGVADRAFYRGVAIAALCLWFVPKGIILLELNRDKTNLVLEAGIVAVGVVSSVVAGKC